MAVDILGASTVETTPKSWPKCAQCSQRLGRLYPMEYFGIIGRQNMPGGSIYVMSVEGRCHGAADVAEIDMPGQANDPLQPGSCGAAFEADAVAQLRFFQRSGTGRHGKTDHNMPKKLKW